MEQPTRDLHTDQRRRRRPKRRASADAEATPTPAPPKRPPALDPELDHHSSSQRTVQVLLAFVRFSFFFLTEEAVLRLPLLRTVWGKSWKRRNPNRLRRFVVEMGGAFIKFGQFFSMRSDILPPVYCRALSDLYDNVPPFSPALARRLIERELERPIEELFTSFDDEPIGAASFGQAHIVTLALGENAGKRAAIKVSRPGSEQQIATDTRLLMLLGYVIDASSLLGQIKLAPVFRDFARWIRREVAYMQEAKNADHLHEVTAWNVRQRIPYIYWEYTTNRVLTMEYLEGIPVSEVIERFAAGDETLDAELAAMDCDRHVIARNLFQSFLLQAFVGRVFHADPHPGNLIVLPENTVGMVDFGLLGRLNEEGRREQMLLLDAVVQENIEALFVAVLDVMDAPRGLAVTDVYDDFAEDADEWLDACDNPGAAMGEKTITRFVDSIMRIARHVGLVLPMQTMLYYKTLLTIDGVLLRLSPDFDYKRESRRAARLIRMRELDKMYGPGAIIDRALSLQILANSAPEFLIQRLQDFEQGKKTIYRKMNLVPVIIAYSMRLIAAASGAAFLGLLVLRLGWLRSFSLLSHPLVIRVVEWLTPSLYALPAVVLVALWLAKHAESRTFQKVQRDE